MVNEICACQNSSKNDCLTTQQRLYKEKIEESLRKNPEENQEFRGLQKEEKHA